jgi:hypothetical protein
MAPAGTRALPDSVVALAVEDEGIPLSDQIGLEAIRSGGFEAVRPFEEIFRQSALRAETFHSGSRSLERLPFNGPHPATRTF